MESKNVVQLEGLDPERIYFIAVDGKTGKVLEEVSMTRRYACKKRLDVVSKAAEHLGKALMISLIKGEHHAIH